MTWICGFSAASPTDVTSQNAIEIACVSAGGVAAGVRVADPLVSLAITALILRITWQASATIRGDQPRFHAARG